MLFRSVGAGKFAWASNPYAAAQAAHIVATGEPTVKKGTKRKRKKRRKVSEVDAVIMTITNDYSMQ